MAKTKDAPASGIPANGSWAPFEPGNTAALRHGAAYPGSVSPIADRLAAELRESAPWTAAPAFVSTVEAWAWAEAECRLYRAWFDEHGLLDDDGEPRRGSARWDRAERRAGRLREELGLTPQSLAALLGRASSVARATSDDGALKALEAEGERIFQARAAGELTESEDG